MEHDPIKLALNLASSTLKKKKRKHFDEGGGDDRDHQSETHESDSDTKTDDSANRDAVEKDFSQDQAAQDQKQTESIAGQLGRTPDQGFSAAAAAVGPSVSSMGFGFGTDVSANVPKGSFDYSAPPTPRQDMIDSILAKIQGPESTNDPTAVNPKTNAMGLYQLTPNTIMNEIYKLNPEMTYREGTATANPGDIATGGVDAGPGVVNLAKNEILRNVALNQPLQKEMASDLTNANINQLASSGINPTIGNVYVAHVLGGGDALKLINSDPNTPVEQTGVNQQAIINNKLAGLTAGQAVQTLSNKLSGASTFGGTAQTTGGAGKILGDTTMGSGGKGYTPTDITFARGGAVHHDDIKHALQLAQNMGRGGDTILAHINPKEAAMLKAMGGSGKINPHTGLMEFEGEGSDGRGDSGNNTGGGGGDSGGGTGGGGDSSGGIGGILGKIFGNNDGNSSSSTNDLKQDTGGLTDDQYKQLMNNPGWGSEDPKLIAGFNKATAADGVTTGPQSYRGELAVGQYTPMTVDANGNPTAGSQIQNFIEQTFNPFMKLTDPKYSKMVGNQDLSKSPFDTSSKYNEPDPFITSPSDAAVDPTTLTTTPFTPFKLPGVNAPYIPPNTVAQPTGTGYADLGANASMQRQAQYTQAIQNALRLAYGNPYYG